MRKRLARMLRRWADCLDPIDLRDTGRRVQLDHIRINWSRIDEVLARRRAG